MVVAVVTFFELFFGKRSQTKKVLCKGTQSPGLEKLVEKCRATSATGNKMQTLTFETGAHLHRNAERTAEGHPRQRVEDQFCAADTVDRETIASGKTRCTA